AARGQPLPEAAGAARGPGGGVEKEMSDLRSEIKRARSDGQLQKALSLAQKWVEQNPNDADAKAALVDIQASIRDKEVEQLCGMALAYVADGETDLAFKIAEKIERMAPKAQRYLDLKKYLQEERTRGAAEALTATARDHLGLGNLEEARAAAEE